MLAQKAYSYAQVTGSLEIGQWNFQRATPDQLPLLFLSRALRNTTDLRPV
jgi:hypothetical protein